MKTLSILLVLALLPTTSQAVVTANCPKELQVTVARIELNKSYKQIKNELGSTEEEELNALSKTYENLTEASELRLSLPLKTTKGGRCVYKKSNSENEKIELYSTNGKDMLYAQMNIGPRGQMLRAYINVRSYDNHGIETSGSSNLALAVPRFPYKDYSAGGSMAFVGKSSVRVR